MTPKDLFWLDYSRRDADYFTCECCGEYCEKFLPILVHEGDDDFAPDIAVLCEKCFKGGN